jgi:hypothetical protein
VTEVSTTSPETVPTPAEPSGRRAWVMVGSLVLALALLIGLTWAAGGFDQRTDLRTTIPPGTTIVTGPYELVFTAVTVQKKESFGDDLVWEVVVSGTGRTTGDEAISPSSLDWFFSVREPVSNTVVEPESQQFGATDRSLSGGSFFTPGLAPVPYRLIFHLPATIDRPTSVQLGVWDLEYRDRSLLRTGELSWARADTYSLVDGLPVQQLADAPD